MLIKNVKSWYFQDTLLGKNHMRPPLKGALLLNNQ